MTTFPKLKTTTISYAVTGETEIRDSGHGLEIPCEYLLEGDTRAVDWLLQNVAKERKFWRTLVTMNLE